MKLGDFGSRPPLPGLISSQSRKFLGISVRNPIWPAFINRDAILVDRFSCLNRFDGPKTRKPPGNADGAPRDGSCGMDSGYMERSIDKVAVPNSRFASAGRLVCSPG